VSQQVRTRRRRRKQFIRDQLKQFAGHNVKDRVDRRVEDKSMSQRQSQGSPPLRNELFVRVSAAAPHASNLRRRMG
jgi:hypothetical protein